MATKVTVTITSPEELAKRLEISKDGRLQKMLTSEIYRRSDPYTPMQQGVLKSQTEVSSTQIKYKVPYARYQWYGKVMVGSAPKRVTNRDIRYHGAPRRGKEWTLRMWKDHGKSILQSIANEGGFRAK